VPYFFDKDHYQAIAHLLVAGDIQARVVKNQSATSIEVKLEDGSAVLWNNGSRVGWTWTVIDKEGALHVGPEVDLPQGADPEAVAAHIAGHPYEVAPERASSL
jgi:hypothetical protein